MRDGSDAPREREPRSPAARERSRSATRQYVKQIDGLFSKAAGGAEAAQLARAMRDARGTPKLAAACRAYRDALGMPADGQLLSIFLDCGDPELVVAAIETLGEAREAGALELTSGQKSQLRTLAFDSNDSVAASAEDLLERLG